VKKFAKYTLVFLVFAVAIFLLGPRPATDETIHFDAAVMGTELDTYLANVEADIPNLRAGAGKEIVWADPVNKAKTPLAIVYVHGFSSTKMETRPVSDNVAKALGANLYFMRLNGHGTDGEGLASATMNDWANDLAEALAIGDRIGEKTVLLSTSTGGTLSVWGYRKPELMKNVVALAMISPNFAIHGASIGMMNMPWAETIMPLIAGKTRSWEPKTEDHAKWWTTSYPTTALLSMGALMRKVQEVDYAGITTPALFIYSDKDKVVVPEVTDEIVAKWGGPKHTIKINDSGDPNHHVIAGAIVSPQTTDQVTSAIIDWIRKNQP